MLHETLEYDEQQSKKKETEDDVIELHHRMPDGKLIALVQICYHCNRQFAYNRKRRHCPSCQQILRTKTMIHKR